MKSIPLATAVVLLIASLSFAHSGKACPFCVAEMQTLSEEIDDADAVVIARLVKPALEPDVVPEEGTPYGTIDPETGAAEFAIEKILKGEDNLVGVEQLEAIFFGDVDFEKRFLIRGLGDPTEWAVPVPLSPLAVEYVQKLPSLPESGADRLAFFQPYLEHDDRQLAQDAYDEFARAPYEDLIALRDRIDRPRVLRLISDPKISPSRRRLFFTMLGVCGQQEDLAMLESLIESDARVLVPATEALAELGVALGGPLGGKLSVDAVRAAERKRKLGLDALVACYLTLRGEDGLDLIDRRILADPTADQTHVYSTLMAIRFLKEETDIVPHARLVQSARLLLDNPIFADQVIPDLARWEDWSVMEKLAQMFRDAGSGKVIKYVREPTVIFLDVASEQEGEVADRALELLAELEPLDPEAFQRARRLQSFGFLGTARALQDDSPTEAELAADALTSDEEQEAMPPNPADFANEQTGDERSDAEPAGPEPDFSSPIVPDTLDPATELPETNTEEQPAEESSLSQRIPAGAERPEPPNRLILVSAPLVTAIGCFGLFWLILRSGGA